MLAALIQYAVTAACFFALDFVWLSLMANRLYRPQIGPELMRDTPALAPAAIFYVIYTVVLTILVVSPSLKNAAPTQALIGGALLGLAGYATYNFTNAATLKHWPVAVTIIDTAWGTILTGLTAWIAVLILQRLT